MTGCARSSSSRSGHPSCWSRIAGVPLRGLKAATAFVLCMCAEVSELLAHDEGGGEFFPLRKGILCVQRMGGMTAAGAIAVQLCVTRTASVYGVNVGRDFWHTPVWTGHGKGVFVSWPGSSRSGTGCPCPSGGSNKLALMPEGAWLRLALPCGSRA